MPRDVHLEVINHTTGRKIAIVALSEERFSAQRFVTKDASEHWWCDQTIAYDCLNTAITESISWCGEV